MMITRRAAIAGVGSTVLLKSASFAQTADSLDDVFDQLAFPPLAALDDGEPFGFGNPTAAQREKAKSIIDATPRGPTPISIAQSFIDRFAIPNSDAISQWPAPSAWNPLIVSFFSKTDLKVDNDMIAWCAAFANWCIDRAGRKTTNSASSQSFLTNNNFRKVDDPEPGDLVVFTCYDKLSDRSVGLGHVAFVKQRPSSSTVLVVGGNQSADRHSSIISERQFPVKPFGVRRHVDGNYIPCVMRINSYVRFSS